MRFSHLLVKILCLEQIVLMSLSEQHSKCSSANLPRKKKQSRHHQFAASLVQSTQHRSLMSLSTLFRFSNQPENVSKKMINNQVCINSKCLLANLPEKKAIKAPLVCSQFSLVNSIQVCVESFNPSYNLHRLLVSGKIGGKMNQNVRFQLS